MAKARQGDYPPEWESGMVQRIMCEMVGWRCEHCGALFNRNRKALELENADGNPAVLTVHHLDNQKWNIHWHNLLVCCQACHLSIQGKWSPGLPLPLEWKTPPAWMIIRGYVPPMQLTLFPEKVRFE